MMIESVATFTFITDNRALYALNGHFIRNTNLTAPLSLSDCIQFVAAQVVLNFD